MALATYNQSPILEDRPWIADLLAKGLREHRVSERNTLSHIHEYAEKQAATYAKSPGGRREYGNGWSELYPECKGSFGPHYEARYLIARNGYLALTSDEAIYPSLRHALVLGPNEAILLRFSRRPALIHSGFWSLTAYNSQHYLIPNRLNRYCLGDRDNMTFPDGTPLSDPSKDGEFHILLQAAELTPPSKWVNNWLPAPAGGGKLSITLRWYGPKEEMTTPSYEYPRIEYIKAMAESASSRL